MSNVKITFKEKENKIPVDMPVFCKIVYNNLYMLIRNDKDSFQLVSVNNGYLQVGKVYASIEDFYNEEKNNIEIVDVEIIVTTR